MKLGFALSTTSLTPLGSGLRPALDLDFTLGVLDSRITFTRTSSATRFNSAGQLGIVASGSPRFDYDPVTLQPLGLLIEEARTNLVLWSEALTDATWSKGGCAVDVDNALPGIDGVSGLNRVTTSTGAHTLAINVSVTPGAAYAFTFYARRGSMTDMKYSVYDNVNLANIIAPTSYYSQVTSTGLTRVTVLFTAPAGCSQVRIYPLRDSGVTGTAYVEGVQVEAGAFATSYIPTTTAAATRAADSAVMTEANFSSWYNQAEGSVVIEAYSRAPLATTTAVMLGFDDGNANGRRNMSLSGGRMPLTDEFLGGVALGAANMGAGNNVSDTLLHKYAFGYKAMDYAMTRDGLAPATTAAVTTVPSKSRMGIGHPAYGTANALYGHVKRIRYWPTRLPNAKLQELTV